MNSSWPMRRAIGDSGRSPGRGSSRIAHDPSFSGRRLRVGYVSADLYRHPVGWLGMGPIRNHDRSRFEVFVYANQTRWDETTRALRQTIDGWRPILGMSAKPGEQTGAILSFAKRRTDNDRQPPWLRVRTTSTEDGSQLTGSLCASAKSASIMTIDKATAGWAARKLGILGASHSPPIDGKAPTRSVPAMEPPRSPACARSGAWPRRRLRRGATHHPLSRWRDRGGRTARRPIRAPA